MYVYVYVYALTGIPKETEGGSRQRGPEVRAQISTRTSRRVQEAEDARGTKTSRVPQVPEIVLVPHREDPTAEDDILQGERSYMCGQ